MLLLGLDRLTESSLRQIVIPVSPQITDAAISKQSQAQVSPSVSRSSPSRSTSTPTQTISGVRKGSELMAVVANATKKLVPVLQEIESELSTEIDLGVDFNSTPAVTGGQIIPNG